jgi:FkbM family methyltransferase
MLGMSLARTALERLSRNRSFARKLPVEFGQSPVVVSPDASLSYWKPTLRSNLFDFAREFVRPGSVVWDVGANVGLLTVAAAQRSGTNGLVVAIEADMFLVGLVRRSAALQTKMAAPIRVIPAAAYESLGLASFHVAQRGRATNFLGGLHGSTQTGGVRETVNVVQITLDWLMTHMTPPDVLKIDVEGAEAGVLRGAEKLLTTARPVVLCEANADSRAEVSAILSRHGYRFYDWDASVGNERVEVEGASFNTLAIPSS